MYALLKRTMLLLLYTVPLIVSLSACSDSNNKPYPATPTSTPFYTLAGGGPCVKLGTHPQPPYTNIQVSDDSFRAHSEPMLGEESAFFHHLA